MIKLAKTRIRNTLAMTVAILFLFISGCLTHAPVNGLIYNGSKGPVAATSGNATDYSKIGKATCHAFNFYISIAWGDCSVQKAQRAGGLTEVTIVDNEIFEILSIYGSYTTVVYGN